jgi:hypothetical protein
MAGLGPSIHDFASGTFPKSWVPAPRGPRRNLSFSLRIKEAALESHTRASMAKGLKFLYLICRKRGRGRGT